MELSRERQKKKDGPKWLVFGGAGSGQQNRWMLPNPAKLRKSKLELVYVQVHI